MFDVKPVKRDGSLDLGKIGKFKKTIALEEKKFCEKEVSVNNFAPKKNNLRLADVVRPKRTAPKPIEKIPDLETSYGYLHEQPAEPIKFHSRPENLNHFFEIPAEPARPQTENENFFFPATEAPKREKKIRRPSLKKRLRKIFSSAKKIFSGLSTFKPEKVREENFLPISQASYAYSFAAVLLLFSLSIPAFSFVQKAFDMKASLAVTGEKALGQFAEAKDNLSASQFARAAVDFSESYQILSDANRDIAALGGNFSEILRFVPGISKVASANYVLSAGEHFSLAGKSLAESAESLNGLGNPLDSANFENGPSLTDLFLNLRSGIEKSSAELAAAQTDLEKVNMEDLPDEMRSQFADLKGKLPVVNASLKNFLDYSRIFLDILGYNGPRKYLFLFQNNQEMRATGGFIGSYGILDISAGRVKKLFVDDIYNPDGQLKARVVPPAPIQKMSAVWTMHDANWFPDFPTSAEKIAWFYEKTGGPTVDGVIAVTPELLKDLLEVTGPIEMPEYDTVVDADNFVEKTQQEVEVEYDKELNQPKKFVADLAPKILDRVFSERGLSPMVRTLQAFDSALSEKHLLLYSRNFNIEKLISGQKWSGEILAADKDFLSVVNTNINGYKTDGVIGETIRHSSDIQDDGSVINTVSVTRRHNGGNEEFDWWNKVNGDWMRVYAPKDAKLLSVSGQTRESVPPALDYASLGFKTDPQVQANEDSSRVDEESGTKIYSENNKTVFANWVYVSPGEEVTITYKYILPFKLSFDDLHHPADSFSVLYQKQSGSVGSRLISEIKLPDNFRAIWHWPDDLKQSGNSYRMETVLDADKFVGMAVEKQ